MTNEETDDGIAHERRSKLSNMAVGKAKEALGRLTHDDDLVQEGRTQEEVAADDVQPDLDSDDGTDDALPPAEPR